jgi:hypothetical protein
MLTQKFDTSLIRGGKKKGRKTKMAIAGEQVGVKWSDTDVQVDMKDRMLTHLVFHGKYVCLL